MNIIAKDLYHPWIERFLQHAIYHKDEPDELMIKKFWSKLKKWSVHPPNRRVKWPPSSVMQKNGKIRPAFFFPRKLASGFPQSGRFWFFFCNQGVVFFVMHQSAYFFFLSFGPFFCPVL